MARDEHTQQSLDILQSTMETMTEDKYRELLMAKSKFHHYSWRNAWLILAQCPMASFVKGFHGWKDMGRIVRKGEKALWILAPRTFSKEQPDGTTKSGMYFASTYVFDISQTDPIPGHPNVFDPTKVTLDPQDENAGLAYYVKLKDWLASRNVPVTEYIGGTKADGYFTPGNKTIGIMAQPRLRMLATLIHETAHYLQCESDNFDAFAEYAGNEVIVESAAFVVMTYLGLGEAVQLKSAAYVKNWLAKDSKSFERGLGEMSNLAKKIIEVLEADAQATGSNVSETESEVAEAA